MQIQHALHWAQGQLTKSDSARLDAELLLAHVLAKSRTYLFTWPEVELSAPHFTEFQRLIEQRQQGRPIAYLIGYREFWGLTLNVNDATLIPRPETELLVELALEHLAPDKPARILDLGTGSGAIALALAKERPQTHVLAVDFSSAALAVAQENTQNLGISNVQFQTSSWFNALPKSAQFKLIVSNPPYIAEQDPHLSQGDVRFEPATALSSGADGLDALREIIQQAPYYLIPQGWLLVEHGYDQGAAVIDLLRAHQFKNIACLQDLAGHDRVSLGQFIPLSEVSPC